ncbi:right-handed parallel beta-helix repeat-containing protein [Actinomadura barringtoniae]|uniref:Right-handed parallel beta-helix repeat-containing protein n=1 Tax=Actinomadura barringtoniae TaxID=1427535 RepID=A0A939PA99_9ACTN|nr:right-handed parallel beta-helix repeat-containing protein [Actinomadura barringtoniae]MBO2449067.1 right-handed parallel beta-helix repeat-containing protein [Actinomadura barringtoniae]
MTLAIRRSSLGLVLSLGFALPVAAIPAFGSGQAFGATTPANGSAGTVPAGTVNGSAVPGNGARGRLDPLADAQRQATLVDQEDQRVLQTRSTLAAILQIGGAATAQWKRPQIFTSAHGKTLVLPAVNNGKPYTVADLVKYGGRYFSKLPDGSYLLSIHVFVSDGAKLVLQNPSGALNIKMASGPNGFSSIVSFGGSIKIEGTAQNPVQIASWTPQSRGPDNVVADGRAYIRAVGGDFKMKYARVSSLGFWSGRTGGIAMTGTDRPASAVKHLNKEQRHQAKQDRLKKNKQQGKSGGGPGDIETEAPGGTATHVPAADLVTGAIDNSTLAGNAFGLFVSGSNQTQITNDRFENSLVDGLVLHRFTKNANVQNTTVLGSGGDGFVLSRATEKVRVSNCTSERNKGNGFTLNGQALAVGPSASGESLQSFGDSSVNNSVAKDNGHYGLELMGGDKLAVQNSKVIGGDMGIVVRAGASSVQISGNQLTKQVRQGIALRDGVTDASLAGNTVVGARTGIYMRNASGTLVGNVIQGATAHGISVTGKAGGSEIRNNSLSGRGTSAVSTSRAHGRVTKEDNNTDGWTDTASLWMKAQRYMTPLNLIWAAVFSMVFFAMARSRGRGGSRIGRIGVHPYELQQPMERRQVWSLPRRAMGAAQSAAQAVGRRMPAQPGRPAPAMAGAGAPGVPVAGPGVPVAGPGVPVAGPGVPVGGPGTPGRPAVPARGPAAPPQPGGGAQRPGGGQRPSDAPPWGAQPQPKPVSAPSPGQPGSAGGAPAPRPVTPPQPAPPAPPTVPRSASPQPGGAPRPVQPNHATPHQGVPRPKRKGG